jgi:hypothetical protein
MSEPGFDVFAARRESKRTERERLYRALGGGSAEPSEEPHPLDELADRVAEKLLDRIVDQVREPEPFFTGVQRSRREHAAALIDALTARR